MNTESFMGPAVQPLVLLVRLALALGAGVFVGLERERRGKSGARTFAMVCVMAGIAGSLGDAYGFVALGIVGVLVVLLNLRQLVQRQDIELTTSAALFVIAFVGILIGRGYTLVPVALAVVTAALLAWKKPLHDFAGGLADHEIRSAIMLALLAFVLFPLLPDAPVDRWNLVYPRAAGVAVIVLAVLGWANYVLWRIYGARGIAVANLLGGLVNSTAAVADLAQRARDIGSRFERLAGRGIMLATGAMIVRNVVIAGALAPATLGAIALPVAVMGVAWVLALWQLDTRWLREGSTKDIAQEPLRLGSPFSLIAVLKFGVVFLGLQVAGTLAQRHLGDVGFYVVSVAGGLFSSSTAVAAAGSMAAENILPVETAAAGALLATITSVLVNIPLVARFGRRQPLTRAVGLATAVVVTSGLIAWIARQFLM